MDVQNISNLESPLYNTLVTRSQRDPWTYSLLSNIGSFSKSRVEVPPQTDPGSFKDNDQEVHWKIPRYGLLAKVCVLNRIEIKDSDGSQTEHADFNDAFGFHLWKELRLETHNKRIQALYPEYQYMRMQSLPYERRQSMQGAVVQDGSALASEDVVTEDDTTKGKTVTRQFYTPAFFAFSERTNNFIDTRFVENLEVVGIARKGKEISTLQGANDKMQFASGYPKLVCYFYNPTEEIYRAYQHRNFTLERPLTMLQYDVFRETPQIMKQSESDNSISPVNGKEMVKALTLKKKLDCNNLVFATHVMVRQKLSTIKGGTSATALSSTCTVRADSRLLFADGCPFADGDFVKITADATTTNKFAGWQSSGSIVQTANAQFLGKANTTGSKGNWDGATTAQMDGQHFKIVDVEENSCRIVFFGNAYKPSYSLVSNSPAKLVALGDTAVKYTVTSVKGFAAEDSGMTEASNIGMIAKTIDSGSIGHRDHKDYLQIENIKVSGTSRELVNQPGFELLHLDNASYGRFADSAGVKKFSGLADANSESIYSLYWGLDNSRVACSGALSLKNLAAPEIEVSVDLGSDGLETDEYELLVFHEYWQLVSIQGSDGRVSVGISV